MKNFMGEKILLDSLTAETLYNGVKDLPIIDFHCHLDQGLIAEDARCEDIGELWLRCDHYKWRAMRMCGVDEYYITGAASYKEKFIKYAEIMPKLFGNPLYYWSHLELKQLLGIDKPINADTAESIYEEATDKLRGTTVRKLLDGYKVEFIATTDSPEADLNRHGKYGKVTVAPTFRPDKVLALDETAITALGTAADMRVETLAQLKEAISKRLDYFVEHGCRISDHGFMNFPQSYASDEGGESIYKKGKNASVEERDSLFGNLLVFLLSEYKKRDIAVQIHCSVKRNVNTSLYAKIGVDCGCDVISPEATLGGITELLDSLSDERRPVIVLYTLDPTMAETLACVSGAYRNVLIGAAWWFNDTLCGIKRNLSTIAEYAVLGTNLGMLTDSRSFLGYTRFDFFRRILCSFVADKVERGEYDADAAGQLVADICYNNVKKLLKV